MLSASGSLSTAVSTYLIVYIRAAQCNEKQMAPSETTPAPCCTLWGAAPWHSSASRVHAEHHPRVTKGHGKDKGFPLCMCPQMLALYTWIREHSTTAVLAGEVQLSSPKHRDVFSWPSACFGSDRPSSQIQSLILFRCLQAFPRTLCDHKKKKNDMHIYTSTELGVAWGRPHTNQTRRLSPYRSLHFSPPKSAHSA